MTSQMLHIRLSFHANTAVNYSSRSMYAAVQYGTRKSYRLLFPLNSHFLYLLEDESHMLPAQAMPRTIDYCTVCSFHILLNSTRLGDPVLGPHQRCQAYRACAPVEGWLPKAHPDVQGTPL